MRKTIDMKLRAAFPMRQKENHRTTTMERLQQVKAASTIQKHFRNWQLRSTHRASVDIEVTDDRFLRVNPDEHQHKSSIQRLFTDNKLTRTLSSLSIRSPFSRKRLDSSSPETRAKTPMTRSYSAYSGRKINNRAILLSPQAKKPSSPNKTRSILRSSDSGGSLSSGKLSHHTMNSSSVASSGRRGHVRKKGHHQVSFFEPNIAGVMMGGDTSSTTQTTISKASTADEDRLDGMIHDDDDDSDSFYSDDDDNSDSGAENAVKDDKCDCKDCLNPEQESPDQKSNILIAPYKKTPVEKALSLTGIRKSSRRNDSSIVNRPRIRSSSPVRKNMASVKAHQLADSALSLREMPNVRL